MIDNDFNTFNTEIQKQNEKKVESKDKRKTVADVISTTHSN